MAVLLTAALASAWPLWIYSTTLAAFGLAHVLSELRYVDGRFGARVGRRLRIWLGTLLLAVVSVRVLRFAELIEGEWVTRLELGFVLALGAGALPALRRAGAASRVVAALALGALVFGLFTSPLLTIMCLAVLHNFTPVGFFAEALRGAERRRAMALSALVFGLVPIVMATGLPMRAMEALGCYAPDLSLLGTGPLAKHLHVYVPKAWQDSRFAVPFFSAVVYAQCMHYAAVLHVMPQLEGQRRDGPLSGMRPALFFGGLAVLGVLLFAGFTQDFSQARSVYGIAAALHAWVEVPLLLMALAPGAVDHPA